MKTIVASVFVFWFGIAPLIGQDDQEEYEKLLRYAYVEVLSNRAANLSNGIKFISEKGDVYPCIGFDKSKDWVRLKFWDWSFWMPTDNIRLVPAEKKTEAINKYQRDSIQFALKERARLMSQLASSESKANSERQEREARERKSLTMFVHQRFCDDAVESAYLACAQMCSREFVAGRLTEEEAIDKCKEMFDQKMQAMTVVSQLDDIRQKLDSLPSR